MEHPKSVIKSKSSNTAITSKIPAKAHTHQSPKTAARPGNKNKKSWSSAEFQGTASKKRGVYVEKRSANGLNTRQAVAAAEEQTPPRRNRKEFLNSIQNILSRGTASTQYPETHDDLKPGKPRKILRRINVETVDKGTQDLDALYQTDSPVRNQSPTNPMPASRSPGNRSPPNRFPVNRSPGNRSPPNRFPSNRSPGNRSPPNRSLANKLPGNRLRASRITTAPRVIRPKFRSRALMENSKTDEKLIVLEEPKKNLGDSPSVQSERINADDRPSLEHPIGPAGPPIQEKPNKLTPQVLTALTMNHSVENQDKKRNEKYDKLKSEIGLTKTPVDETIDSVITSDIHKSLNETVTNQISLNINDAESETEGKQLKKAKVLRIDEPSTLVSEYKPKKKSLYNFFVDLLETTLSVYNVNTDFHPEKSIDSRSNEMVIDNTIVQKLNMPEKPKNDELFSDSNFKRVKKNMNVIDEISTDKIEVYKIKPNYKNMNPPILKQPRNRSRCRRHNLHTESYSYNLLYRSESPRTQTHYEGFDKPQKPTKARSKKQTLLNLLKEELQMDDDAFEEPQTFHQALKIIARNKRRNRRYIHFEDQPRRRTKDQPDCMFKRRKIISSSTKSTRKNKKFRIYNPQTTFMDSIKTSAIPRKFSASSVTTQYPKKHPIEDKDVASYHSIEVSAFAYEPDQVLRSTDNKNKTILYAFHSVESIVESLSSKDFLEKKKKGSYSSGSSTSIDQLLADYSEYT